MINDAGWYFYELSVNNKVWAYAQQTAGENRQEQQPEVVDQLSSLLRLDEIRTGKNCHPLFMAASYTTVWKLA